MGGQPGAAGQSDPITMFLPLIMIIFVFYFMIYRPNQKTKKEKEARMSQLEKGDKIITGSGIHGTVSAIEDGTVLVQVADNMKIRFEKHAIAIVNPKNAEKKDESKK